MKLSACVLTYNHETWIRSCLDSLKNVVDRIIIIDGGSKDSTLDIISEYHIAEVHFHKWHGNIGIQRNNYLRYLEEGEWAIVMDSDEVLSDNGFMLREILEKSEADVLSVRMEHFIWNLGLVDATKDKHYVPRRIFRFTKGMNYPHTRHCVLDGFNGKMSHTDEITIFHCGYLSGIPDVARKHKENIESSEIHSKEFLMEWYAGLALGTYKVKKYEGPYPLPIREKFMIGGSNG